ncbi:MULTISPECIES: hypothetical protein [Actinomycetes]
MASPGPRRMPRRQSAAVYRRRRLVVGALLLVVLVGLWWAGSAIFALLVDEDPHDPTAQQEDDTEGGSGSESDSDEGSDEGAASEEDPDADSEEDSDAGSDADTDDVPEGHCAPGDIRVIADTDDAEYSAAVAPLLILTVQNVGDEDCTLDVGTAEQEFTVSHAGREVFTTTECGGEADSYELTMEPGQQERAQLSWPRSDSSASCTEPVELEPGAYELTVSLGGITSEPHRFTLK